MDEHRCKLIATSPYFRLLIAIAEQQRMIEASSLKVISATGIKEINTGESRYEGEQSRINHCAGCTMAGGPRRQGLPDQLPNFYHAVLTFERFNVQCSLKRKKVVNFFGKSAPLEKILATRMRKGSSLTLAWGPPNG